MVEYFDESYFKDYSKSEVKVKTKKFVSAERYEALEAKLARLVDAAEICHGIVFAILNGKADISKIQDIERKLKAAVDVAKVKS